jgi:ankyrin repeat protein
MKRKLVNHSRPIVLDQPTEIVYNFASKGSYPHDNNVLSMRHAINVGDFEKVKSLAGKGVDISRGDECGTTFLMRAAAYGLLPMVSLLVDLGANVNHVDEEGRGALMYAARNGHLEVVLQLVEYGAKISCPDLSFNSAVLAAAESGNIELMIVLVKLGMNILTENDEGRNALMIAADRGRIEMVVYLQEIGISVHETDTEGLTALMIAAKKSRIDVVNFLVTKGADVLAVDYSSRTALMYASICGRLEIATKLVAVGANINAVDKYGDSAFTWAVFHGHQEVVEMLVGLEASADLIQYKNGDTALHMAFRCRKTEAVKPMAKLLLQLMTPATALRRNHYGITTLMLAAYVGDFLTVKSLLELGASTDDTDIQGNTALHYACYRQNLTIAKLLSEAMTWEAVSILNLSSKSVREVWGQGKPLPLRDHYRIADFESLRTPVERFDEHCNLASFDAHMDALFADIK